MKRLRVTALFLCMAALAMAQAPLVPADSLADRAAELLAQAVPASGALYLDVQTGPLTDALDGRLTELLLQRGQTLLTAPDGNCLIVQVRSSETVSQHGANTLFSRTLRQETAYRFSLRLVRNETIAQAGSYELRTQVPLVSGELVTMRWYDPFLASTVLGGLIYLFYYGSD